LVKAFGLDGISKSEVSRICAELDPIVEAFRTRPLTGVRAPRVREHSFHFIVNAHSTRS
jgi:transposase-like protein